MRYSKEVIRRNVRVRELLDEVWRYSTTKYKTYIKWYKIPPQLIKELIELEVIDLERDRFLRAPIHKVERNFLIHRRTIQ